MGHFRSLIKMAVVVVVVVVVVAMLLLEESGFAMVCVFLRCFFGVSWSSLTCVGLAGTTEPANSRRASSRSKGGWKGCRLQR